MDAPKGGRAFRCARCGLVTPRMNVASDEVAAKILTAAGWDVQAELPFCPPCTPRAFQRAHKRRPPPE